MYFIKTYHYVYCIEFLFLSPDMFVKHNVYL